MIVWRTKIVCKDFGNKKFRWIPWLYVQRNTLLLADVFENLRNMCLNIYAVFVTAPGLAWQGAFKKTKVKLDLLTEIDMLLIIEKGIRGGIYHSIPRYEHWKDYDKNKEWFLWIAI